LERPPENGNIIVGNTLMSGDAGEPVRGTDSPSLDLQTVFPPESGGETELQTSSNTNHSTAAHFWSTDQASRIYSTSSYCDTFLDQVMGDRDVHSMGQDTPAVSRVAEGTAQQPSLLLSSEIESEYIPQSSDVSLLDQASDLTPPAGTPGPGYTHENEPSHYLQSFNTLTYRFGNGTKHDLNPSSIIKIIKIGDSFLRDDAVSFVSSHLGGVQNNLWYQPIVPDPTTNSSLTEKLFKSFCCTGILEQRSALDPIRLRIARILLYQYSEQLYKDSHSKQHILNRRSRGRDTTSAAIDQILEEMYTGEEQHDPETWRKRRNLLKRHKKIGRRWCILIRYIGSGLLVMCSSELATHM
jgi:hypothetical protein